MSRGATDDEGDDAEGNERRYEPVADDATHREGAGPGAIRSIAVRPEDVVAALEARGRDESAALRVTPPFAPRMRARLHVTAPDGGGETDGTPSPITLQPSALVTDAPPVPHPDDTEDALRSDPDATYTPERHHERHTAALDRWRSTTRDRIVDAVGIDDGDGGHTVEVKQLG